jgi:dolichyl-phosphate beta-glucosyltransferase
VTKHQSRSKELLGQLGNGLIQLLAAPGIKDTQCGFKLFSRRTAKLFQQQRLERWGYDFEILFLARMAGLKMIEVPVRWVNDARSKVKSTDYLTTLFDLIKIHYFRLRGYYKF